MTILIGVDESPFSRAAVDAVCDLGWPRATRVVVVHAVGTPLVAYAQPAMPAGPAVDAAEERHRHGQRLVGDAETTLRSSGLDVETRVVRGDPRAELVDEARRTGADLVVLGSHGHSGLGRLLMGSVASHVVSHAPCSVLVVKRTGKAPAGNGTDD